MSGAGGSLSSKGEMLRLLSGYWFSQTLYVAATLRIADRLVAGPKDVETLAREAAVDAQALFRLLRGLSSAGIFAEVGARAFALTPLAETLIDGREGSLRSLALLGGHPLHWRAWGGLLESVKTGETAFDVACGTRFFDAILEDPSLAAAFGGVQSALAEVDGAVVEALDVGGARRIVDVGGGAGELARRLAEAWPLASVVLFDRAEALRAARSHPRVEAVTGDFFAGVPENGDAYLMKFVLHDWDDERAAQILSSCRKAMGRGARLFIVEVVVPEGGIPSPAKVHDVNMLVLTGGRERTLAEWRALLGQNGFAVTKVIATRAGVSVLESALAP